MLPILLAIGQVAGGSEGPLFRSPRIQDVELRGAADLDLDGIADIYSEWTVVMSDGAFGIKSEHGVYGDDEIKVAEMTGDGFPDLVTVVNSFEQVCVQQFNPHALFVFDGLPDPQRVAAGDVDDDGANDVVAAGAAGSYHLLLGDGKGALSLAQNGTLSGKPRHAEMGDLNGDGSPDLVVAVEPGGLDVSLAHGGLPAPTTWFPSKPIHAFQLADADADGDLDVAAAGVDFAEVLLGDGSGGFAAGAPTPLAQLLTLPQVQVVDFDLSGTLDVVVGDGVSCDLASLIVAHGDGLGGIASTEELQLWTPSLWFALADYDGDGDDDLAYSVEFRDSGTVPGPCPELGNVYTKHVIFAERVGGELLLPHSIAPPATSFALADATVNPRMEVVMLSPGKLEVLESDGSDGFTTIASLPLSFAGEEVLAPDLDADGLVDLVAFPDELDPPQLGVHLGAGGGTFASEVLHAFDGIGSRAAFADWTGDGLPDLMAPRRFDDSFYLYPAQTGATFGAPKLFLPLGWDIFTMTLGNVEPLDIDLDGDLDVVTMVGIPGFVPGFPGSHARTLLGDGTGSFLELPEIFPPDPIGPDSATADFDVDGWPDVVWSSLLWYRGIGGGELELMGDFFDGGLHGESISAGVRAADVDGNGIPDVMTGMGTILRAGSGGLDGTGNVDLFYSIASTDCQASDLVGDGAVDLVSLQPHAGLVVLEGLLGCSGSFATYGGGCIGSNGSSPALFGGGCPTPGGVFELAVARGLPLTPAYASFGLGQGAIPLPNGCELLLNPWIPVFVGFTLDASGEGSLPIAISPAAAPGVTATAQVGLFDPGAPGYFTLSNGLAITVE